MKITSAMANKLLKQLEEEKSFLRDKETKSCTYDAAEGETPIIPDYDYATVSSQIGELDRKIRVIKHALNLANSQAQIPVEDDIMSVDEILLEMAQLNNRKGFLDYLRKLQPKERLQLRTLPSRNAVPEYRYINFDNKAVQADFETVSNRIMAMQLALDKHNQTEEFEVTLE